jgi:hypothetical protein
MATARLALEARQYVARKRDCHLLYRRWIGDGWTSLLEDVYHRCRGAWHALIPTGEVERQQLRGICARTLAFENDFLQRYKRFLLTELPHGDDPAHARAVWILGQIPWCDADILATVRALAAARAGGEERPVAYALWRLQRACK